MANTNRSDIHELFLQLVRLGIGADSVSSFKLQVSSSFDWEALWNLAAEQGLSAIVVDGLEKLPVEQKPPKLVLLQWIGEVLQGESVYATQWKAACEMAQVFEDSGIRTYVLKGFVVSECYPKPEHRVSVDLDCFLINDNHNDNVNHNHNDNLGSIRSKSPKKYNQNQSEIRDLGHFEAWELGNKLMEENGYEVDRSFYKNSTISLPGLTVENHQFMTAVRGSKRLKSLERLLQGLFNDNHNDNDNRFEGTSMFRPPVMVSALFLIEHAYAHFLHEGLTWRMVLDWVMFSKKHKEEVDWAEFNARIDEFGFRKFYDSFSLLGKYLIGEGQEVQSLSVQDQSMLKDVWAPLDLHEFHGVKGKLALAGNEIRAAWKYHYFSPDSMIGDLLRRVKGFVFERHPKI